MIQIILFATLLLHFVVAAAGVDLSGINYFLLIFVFVFEYY